MLPISIDSDDACSAMISRTDQLARAMSRDRAGSAVEATKRAANVTAAQADILRHSTFYDQDVLDVVRLRHHADARVASEMARHALHGIALIFSDAHAILSRLLMGRPTPALIDATGEAALKQRPAYNAARAGVHAAQADLAQAEEKIPGRPTVPREDAGTGKAAEAHRQP
jgi:outer membrane protein TolC